MSMWARDKGDGAADPIVVTAATAMETGLLDEAVNYEFLRETEEAVIKEKKASGERLLSYLSGWQAEYPDRAFDLAGTENGDGQVIRLRIQQTAPRKTIDAMRLRQALFEAGVDMEVTEAAIEQATKVGEAGAPYPAVRRVKGRGAVAL